MQGLLILRKFRRQKLCLEKVLSPFHFDQMSRAFENKIQRPLCNILKVLCGAHGVFHPTRPGALGLAIRNWYTLCTRSEWSRLRHKLSVRKDLPSRPVCFSQHRVFVKSFSQLESLCSHSLSHQEALWPCTHPPRAS